MSLSSNRILGGGCKKDIQTAVIKTKNVGENRKNRKKNGFSLFLFLLSLSFGGVISSLLGAFFTQMVGNFVGFVFK